MALGAGVPIGPRLEPHEEFPSFRRDPVHTGSGIRIGARMPSLEGAEFHGISILATRKFGGDVFVAVCQGYRRR